MDLRAGGDHRPYDTLSKKNAKWIHVGEMTLRVFEFLLTLLAFSLAAAGHGFASSQYTAVKYLIASCIIAWIYSIVKLGIVIASFALKGKVITRRPHVEHVSFFLDLGMAFLLLSSASAAAAVWDAIGCSNNSNKCVCTSASCIIAFIAFICFCVSAFLSWHRWKEYYHHHPSSPTSQL